MQKKLQGNLSVIVRECKSGFEIFHHSTSKALLPETRSSLLLLHFSAVLEQTAIIPFLPQS